MDAANREPALFLLACCFSIFGPKTLIAGRFSSSSVRRIAAWTPCSSITRICSGPLWGQEGKEPPSMSLLPSQYILGSIRIRKHRNMLCRIEALNEIELQPMIEGVPLEWRSRELERDTIWLLTRNQQTLRQRAKEVSEKLLDDERSSLPGIDRQNERSTHM